jgi:hypothetical protein
VHDYDPGRRVNALFQTLPGASFSVDGARAPEDAALLSAAAELRLTNGVTLIGSSTANSRDAPAPSPERARCATCGEGPERPPRVIFDPVQRRLPLALVHFTPGTDIPCVYGYTS